MGHSPRKDLGGRSTARRLQVRKKVAENSTGRLERGEGFGDHERQRPATTSQPRHPHRGEQLDVVVIFARASGASQSANPVSATQHLHLLWHSTCGI